MADNSGFIVLYRKMIGWEWYTDNNVKSVFLHCLLKANHKDNEWKGIIVERGSFVSSYGKMAIELGLSVKQIRVALDKLKKTGEVAIKTTNKYSIIKVINYSDYQDKDKQKGNQEDTQEANKGQTKGNQMATNNNDNNYNNDNNDNKSNSGPEFSEGNIPVIVTKIQETIKPTLNSFDVELIKKWSQEYSLEIIFEAVRTSALNNASSLNYTDSVLRNWKNNNIKTLKDLEFQRAKRSPKSKGQAWEASTPEWMEKHEEYRKNAKVEEEDVNPDQVKELLKSFKKGES